MPGYWNSLNVRDATSRPAAKDFVSQSAAPTKRFQQGALYEDPHQLPAQHLTSQLTGNWRQIPPHTFSALIPANKHELKKTNLPKNTFWLSHWPVSDTDPAGAYLIIRLLLWSKRLTAVTQMHKLTASTGKWPSNSFVTLSDLNFSWAWINLNSKSLCKGAFQYFQWLCTFFSSWTCSEYTCLL